MRFETRAEMTAASFEGIEVFYNRERPHSPLGYQSLAQFLKIWIHAQQMENPVA